MSSIGINRYKSIPLIFYDRQSKIIFFFASFIRYFGCRTWFRRSVLSHSASRRRRDEWRNRCASVSNAALLKIINAA